MASTLGPRNRLNTAPATIIKVQTPTTAAQLTPALGPEDCLPLGLFGELGLDPADASGGAAAVKVLGEHPAQDHDRKAGNGGQLGQKEQGRGADGRGESAFAQHQQLQQGGQVEQQVHRQKGEGRLPGLAVEKVEGPEQQSRKADGAFAAVLLHLRKVPQVGGAGGAQIGGPVLGGDAVDGLVGAGSAGLPVTAALGLLVQAGVIEAAGALLGLAVGVHPGRGRRAGLKGRTAVAAAGGVLRVGGAAVGAAALGPGRGGGRPFKPRAVLAGVDAGALFFVAGAVIGRAAVGTYDNIVRIGQGLPQTEQGQPVN